MRAIESASLDDPQVRDLVVLHQRRSLANSPPGTSFALDLDGLRRPEITLFALREGEALLGIGALMEIAPDVGEVKSLRTADAALRQGVGKAIMDHIIAVARERGYASLMLETGSTADYLPANALYQRLGFCRCGPFGQYTESDFNLFYRMDLTAI